MKFSNLLLPTRKLRWTYEEIEFLRNNSFLKDHEMSQKLNRSINSIRAKRRRLGINKKFQSKYEIDLNFFKNWTREMAYILGYIYADGSIRIRRSGSELSIKSKDLIILKSMNNAMNSGIPIYTKKIKTGYIHNMRINRREIVQDLLKLGVTPRKSKVMVFPEVPKQFLYDFIRGYFDGDGHVRILGNSLEVIFTSGSKRFLEALNIILENQGIKSKIYTKLQGSWFYLSILNESREIFYKKLYKNPTLFLKRKSLIFQRFFKYHHHLTIICKDCGRRVIKTGNNHKRCKSCKKEYIKELNRHLYRKERQSRLIS